MGILKELPIVRHIRSWKHYRKEVRIIRDWQRKGRPAPPPHCIKRQTLLDYAQNFGLDTLVETGTYKGEMIEALRRKFRKIYSIELSSYYYERAKERFKRHSHVSLIQGDSGVELPRLIKKLNSPTLFWLDGHYSGGKTAKGIKETPILEEINSILSQNLKHVIIIDDARCFGSEPDYPSQDLLRKFILERQPEANITVINDCIRVTL